VDAEKSKELIERSALFDLLMPGFKVWNFYAGDTYGTFVTQGTAPVSPNTVNRKAKKKLIDEKDQAISERDSLALEINDLEDKKNQLISQLEMLNNEKDKMIEKINEMSQINQEMKTDLNSIAYLVDLKENLIKKGIIKGGFLKSKNLNEFKAEDFTQSIDLRAETKINIDAQSLNVKKIRNISLYPKFYKQNVDYSVSFQNENQLAVLTILNPAKLRNEKVVISVN
jgi:sugar-specific transcriptional regulator TrmB